MLSVRFQNPTEIKKTEPNQRFFLKRTIFVYEKKDLIWIKSGNPFLYFVR